jgi:nucleotide-binding universal stress UspA family protein
MSIVGDSDNRLQESLFKGDQAVLSNQDIDRILTARITLEDRHRLVVLRLNARNIWVQEIAELETRNSEQFLKALAKASQLTQVRFMPTLLIPERRTVPYLREAAARFQADLLLVYGTGVRTFQRDRLVGVDEVHADAVVASVLLDVRTGIVIHAAQATESISAKKTLGDLNFSQTVVKAQTEATGKALLKLADAVVEFAGPAK